MKVLLIGEASFLHNTLKDGLTLLGHRVTTMSDGNNWHNAPRDIDLRRDMRLGKLGGLKVVWQLVCHLPKLVGNDVVQIHNYQFVPLKYGWNTAILRFLKCFNKRIVKGCFGDDPQIFRQQALGIPHYSDTFWNGKPQNVELNRERIAEVSFPAAYRCWKHTTRMADALCACLYEYWLCYNEESFCGRIHYLPLPVKPVPAVLRRVKGCAGVINVLVGIQPGRDFMKGAGRMAKWIEDIAERHPGMVRIKYVEGVPYDEYMQMLCEADVLVDQLYSFTPSMNSLAAMARGTVVIGGGEEEFYEFIGEKVLRPIINVSPELSDAVNTAAIEKVFFTDGCLSRMSSESMEFVDKYHDFRKVAMDYERLYKLILAR